MSTLRLTGPGVLLGVVALLPLTFLAVFFALPVGGMLARGLWVDGAFDPGGIVEVLGRSRVHRVLWFTVWSAGLATLITLLLGLPVTLLIDGDGCLMAHMNGPAEWSSPDAKRLVETALAPKG